MDDRSPRAYGYVRVSTNKQALSPDAQRDAIARAAKAVGMEIHQWFQDAPVVSEDGTVNAAATSKIPMEDRRAGRELCCRVQKGDHIFVARLDRAFRSLREYVNQAHIWDRLGVVFHAADMGSFDTNTPIGKMIFSQLVIFAELERNLCSQRTRESLACRKRKQGHASHKHAGYGWKWVRKWISREVGYRKERIRDEEEREVMRRIVQLRDDKKMPWGDIYLLFDREKLLIQKLGQPPRPWSVARVQRAYQAELTLRLSEHRSGDK